MARALRRRVPELARSVSVTTRPPRLGERRDVHYRFVSAAQFQQLRRRGGFVEWARVHGACYGTPKVPIQRALAAGRDVLLSIDVHGASQLRRRFGTQAVLIFVLPPSWQDLRRRLASRRTETPDAIRRRLRTARKDRKSVV